MSGWAPYVLAAGVVIWFFALFFWLALCVAAKNGDTLWSRALEDRDDFREIFVDQDLTNWQWPKRRDG